MNVCHMASHFSFRLGLQLWPSKQIKTPSHSTLSLSALQRNPPSGPFFTFGSFLFSTMIFQLNAVEINVEVLSSHYPFCFLV